MTHFRLRKATHRSSNTSHSSLLRPCGAPPDLERLKRVCFVYCVTSLCVQGDAGGMGAAVLVGSERPISQAARDGRKEALHLRSHALCREPAVSSNHRVQHGDSGAFGDDVVRFVRVERDVAVRGCHPAGHATLPHLQQPSQWQCIHDGEDGPCRHTDDFASD